MSLEARLLDPAQDYFGLVELYETVFGHTATPEMWYWKYMPPWTQRHYCYVAKVDGKVIGYVGAVPLRGMIDDEEVPYFQLADMMVHPEYRLKYDYFELGSKQILDDINREFPKHVVYGFSGHRAFRIMERSGMAGFVEKAQTRYAHRATQASSGRYEFVAWDWSAAEVDVVWAKFRPAQRAGLMRDSTYLKWRYGSHPVHGYKLYGVLENGEPVGYVVMGCDRPSEHGRAAETPIVDSLLPENSTRTIVHDFAHFIDNDVMTWLRTPRAPDFEATKDSGTHCYHFLTDSAVDTEFLREELYYTMGDVDWW